VAAAAAMRGYVDEHEFGAAEFPGVADEQDAFQRPSACR
jgi:hypothetical protein